MGQKKIAFRKEHTLAKPNFNFQKRQRELEKKKKKEEKKQRKLEKNSAGAGEDPGRSPAEREDEQIPGEAGGVSGV